jgi:N-acetylneuraminate synthase
MASKPKPIILSTGASDLGEVVRAVRAVLEVNHDVVVMQCNTNYTGSPENYDHIHLNVLKTFGTLFPDVLLGLSDHTLGHAAVLGAVTLGARVIEKHFTDDNERSGPDHPFAMNPKTWSDMVAHTRELERALGSTDKFVADNEQQTAIVQRRCLRAARDIMAGEVFDREMIDVLRPATPGTVLPYEIENVIGTRALSDIPSGKELRWTDLTSS